MQTGSQTHLIVDGYNVIGAWSPLRKLVRHGQLELARIQLVEQLSSFVAFRDYRAIVVFDAYAQPTAAAQETSPAGIEIYYTAYGETADSVIERMCAQLRWQCRVRVATSDRLQQLMVAGYDAEWIHSEQLLEEVKQTREQIRRTKLKPTKVERGIDGYLNPSVRDRLAHWRIHGIDPAR